MDFTRRRIGVRAEDGHFPLLSPENEESLALQRCFTRFYECNHWKSGETRSGPGSTWKSTIALRHALGTLFQELGVRQLVEAGCGDLIWNADITLDLDLYLGFDIVEALVAHNRMLYGRRKNHFFNTANICRDTLPKGDALLCRNTLTHLPNHLVQKALEQFKLSGSRYLLTTTFSKKNIADKKHHNDDIVAGQWRPIDLMAPPFSLPPPQQIIPDGIHGGGIGVWKLSETM
ncbi:MAG: class I SAM-dependent methyltransferase [Magnetococcales bacterium]|nr:class I SAM-dependent methyltransferase [Magnetococcales bacterium]